MAKQNIEVPSDYDMFQIAFLTMKGWTCEYNNIWKKKNFVRQLDPHYYDGETESELFDRDEAFDAQLAADAMVEVPGCPI